jgi:hypothetical protein
VVVRRWIEMDRRVQVVVKRWTEVVGRVHVVVRERLWWSEG